MQFYLLAKWAFPDAVAHKVSANKVNELALIEEVVKALLESGREDGFFMAIRYLHDNYDRLLLSSKSYKSAGASISSQTRLKALFSIVETNIDSDRDLATTTCVASSEIDKLRQQISHAIERYLPVIFILIFNPLYQYSKLAISETHRDMSRLLYIHALLASRRNHSLVKSSGIEWIIKLINPEQDTRKVGSTSSGSVSIKAATIRRAALLQELRGFTTSSSYSKEQLC